VSNSGGTVYIQGTLDNTGGWSGLGQAVLYGGTIEGGTVTSALGFSNRGGTLSGVTYAGTLDLSGYEDNVHLASGTTVNAGTINDTGYDSYLFFDNT
jgi:hypothetical protein